MNRKSDIASKKIRLMLLSSVFVDRGVERIILWLWQYLPKDLYHVEIVVLRDKVPFSQRLKKNGQDVIRVMGMKHLMDFCALIRFYKFVKEFRPDVVHIHHYRAAILCRPILKMCKTPVILYSVHNRWGGQLHFLLDRWTTRFGDATIPFSKAVKDFLLDKERIDKAKVTDPIYIGIDVERFRVEDKGLLEAKKKDLGIARRDKVIGFVGALSEQKGLNYLIDCIKKLCESQQNIKCILIGEGNLKKRLKERAASLKVQDRVLLLGQRYDIPELLGIMDVFVLPSLWEGLPQAVLEALAAKCPVVATAVNGIPEIIEHGFNGLLVPPRDSTALSGAITSLFEEKGLRDNIVRNGYETVCHRFSVNRMVSDFDEIYRQQLALKRCVIPKD